MTADREAAPSRWMGLAILLVGVLMIVMDQTITAVVLPHIARDLAVSLDAASLSVTVFMIAAAVALAAMGQVADAVGQRRMVTFGFAAFAVGSLMTAMADNLAMLLLGRAFQGLVFAALAPSIQGLVNITFPSGPGRTLAFALWSTTTASAVAIGPLVGGAFASFSSWRWAFLVNLPVCAFVALGAWMLLDRDRLSHRALALDVPGMALVGLTMTAIVLAFQEGTSLGWWSAQTKVAVAGLSPVPVLIVGALISAVALFLCERGRARAGRAVLLDPKVLSVASYRIALGASALMSMSLYGLMILLPIFIQFVLGAGPFLSGVSLFVLGAGMVSGGLASTVLINRFGKRSVALWCLAVQVVLLLAMLPLVHATGSPLTLAVPLFPFGFAYTVAFSAFMNALLADVPHALSSRASGISSTLRLGFDAVSTAMMVGLMVGLTVASAARTIETAPGLTATERASLNAMTHFRAGAGAALEADRETLARLSDDARTVPVVSAVQDGFVAAGRGGLIVAVLLNILALFMTVRIPRAAQLTETDNER